MKAHCHIAVGFSLALQLFNYGCTRSSLSVTQTANCQGGIKVVTRATLHCVFNENELSGEFACPENAANPYRFRGALICSEDDSLSPGALDEVYGTAWPTGRDEDLDMMVGDAIRLVAYELDSDVMAVDSIDAADTE
ncbi:MAG: hypothetical protein ACON3Z_14990 [Bradymonadia bacterium]